MSLKEQQDLLAKLYTDPDLQLEFAADPSTVLSRYEIGEDESESFSVLADVEIKFFADSLVAKRFREVRKLLSISANCLGPRFRECFVEFAPKYNPTSVKKHAEDATAFSQHLLEKTNLNDIERDAIAFESTRLRHILQTRTVSFARLRHDPNSLSDSVIKPIRQGGIAIWITPSKETRFAFIKLPFI